MKFEKRYYDLNKERLEAFEKQADLFPQKQRNEEWVQAVVPVSMQEADLRYRILTALVDRVAEMNDMNVTMERISDLQATAVLESDYVLLMQGEIRDMTKKLLELAEEIELRVRDGMMQLRLNFRLTR